MWGVTSPLFSHSPCLPSLRPGRIQILSVASAVIVISLPLVPITQHSDSNREGKIRQQEGYRRSCRSTSLSVPCNAGVREASQGSGDETIRTSVRTTWCASPRGPHPAPTSLHVQFPQSSSVRDRHHPLLESSLGTVRSSRPPARDNSEPKIVGGCRGV